MKNIIFVFIVGFSFLTQTRAVVSSAFQDTVFNQTDQNGLKQGYWKKYFPNGNLSYTAFFVNDKPVGQMVRYHEKKGIKALMTFDKNGDYAKAKLYYENGSLMAEGNYYQSKKDSIWKYFSYYTGSLTSTERFEKGIKQGKSQQFYPNGRLFEEIYWVNDKKHGDWIQYFENGKNKMLAKYTDGQLSGEFIVFNVAGKVQISGFYKENVMHGIWTYFDEQGNPEAKINYVFGIPENQTELTEKEQEFFNLMERNKGKYSDPVPEDFFPGNSGY
ncbi:MAG: hypothetical protein JXJ22_12820 [Bacteroidales bacterium]|nr:hypothetical protein [Bacteroidales bacterium]